MKFIEKDKNLYKNFYIIGVVEKMNIICYNLKVTNIYACNFNQN